jgi:hypothetical protein
MKLIPSCSTRRTSPLWNAATAFLAQMYIVACGMRTAEACIIAAYGLMADIAFNVGWLGRCVTSSCSLRAQRDQRHFNETEAALLTG